MDRSIYLEKRSVETYPEGNRFFHPSINYPEYAFGTEFISKEKNEIYDMVRASLLGLGLDEKKYDTKEWNPMSDIIEPGDIVLVKPNMVKDYNTCEQYECTLTHPSITRAVIDYCLMAHPSKIILGDAPVQSGDMDKILKDYGYGELLDFYEQRGISIEFADFRKLVVKAEHGVLKEVRKDSEQACININLGVLSNHSSRNGRKYRINRYTDEHVNQYHSNSRHEYVIAKEALEADVIINLPKPKTHRFAGITGALKNFVGVCSDKECLPHYSKGTPENDGDETNKRSVVQQVSSGLYMKSLKEGKKNHFIRAHLLFFLYRIIMQLKRNDVFVHGAWYGNDTIWRTIIDINLIIHFVSKEGSLDLTHKQRKILTIGDMIIAGEKDGPLSPSPKKLGCVLASRNCVVFDYVFCKITGFDEEVIPVIKNSINEKHLMPWAIKDIILYSNLPEYNGQTLQNLSFSEGYHFQAHPFWKDKLNK